MRIKVINPNTSAAMTAVIEKGARAVCAPGTLLVAVNPSMGPESIESHYDSALAVPGLLAEIAADMASPERADAYVIACFGDPGLAAARELADVPVVGIAEAAMHAATFLGRGFSVVTTLGRTAGRAWDLAREYGFADKCLGVHACEIPVLELETDALARERVAQMCALALERDGSDSIVLGCAGMADFAAGLSVQLGVPVIDGVTAAVAFAQALATLGLSTGKRGEFARPLPKNYIGVLDMSTFENMYDI